MKAWELMYKEEDLKEAKMNFNDVKIIENDGVEIIGKIENFKVTTYIQFNSPSLASCNCPQKTPCKHEAILIYYLENHPELFLTELNFEEIFNLTSDDDLKKFLLNELKKNSDLKNKFLKEFKTKSPINKRYYKNKLKEVFKSGEGKDYQYHEIYDLDLMESDLNDFLTKDISDILIAGEHDFACDLLCEIGDLLDDELMSSYDSWYELADSFMQNVFILSTSIYLDSEKMNELNFKTSLITERISVF